jgi:putative hemolysin
MSNSTLITILVILILFSGIFSATETAFSSLSSIKLKFLIEKGNQRAKKTLHFAEQFESLLVLILVGNNIVNILSASLATVLFIRYFMDLGVTISTVVMTILVLIFGEITPKTFAKTRPEQFAMWITPLIQLLNFIMYPITILFIGIQRLFTKAFKTTKSVFNDEELMTFVNEIEKEGGITTNERDLIQKVIDFDELKVDSILTPRIDVKAIELSDDIEAIKKEFELSGYTRLPIFDGDLDHIIGIIHYKDFMKDVISKNKSLKSAMKLPIEVTEYMRVVDLMQLLQSKKEHLAIVKDEYGGTLGIASLEDILEQLVGDIWDEHDDVSAEILTINDHTYHVSGSAEVEEVLKYLKIDFDTDAQTMNGFVQEQLGVIPRIHQRFQLENYEFKILKANHKMVQLIEIKKSTS